MGLLGGIFGSKEKKEKKELPWQALTNVEQLETVANRSKERPQLLFKHSTTCGISRMVLNMFTDRYDLGEEDADLYFIDLHAYRPVSNAVAEKFQVLHQSPQLLIIKGGTTVYHASHGAIADTPFEQYL